MHRIPFNRPNIVGTEFDFIREAIENRHLSGNGAFTKKCQKWLETQLGGGKALLTHSCTAALEMAAILLDLGPGDEIIMPSYTFVSTANAFVLRGATPVFVDIRSDTLNLDETLIEDAITPRTRAICVVHYSGVGCEMDTILAIAGRHGLTVVEDAAQGLMAYNGGRPLASIGHLAAVSFHETKNVISGEGGALIINQERWQERAEIVWEKGTNRSQFFRGQVDKYTWVDVGSSFLPSEINAAFLWAQLQRAQEITTERLRLWSAYNEAFADLEASGRVRRPVIPSGCRHNGHMFYLILDSLETRTRALHQMNLAGVNVVFHYVPLHNSPAGRRWARTHGHLARTEDLADRLVRLPLWPGLSDTQVQQVFEAVRLAIS